MSKSFYHEAVSIGVVVKVIYDSCFVVGVDHNHRGVGGRHGSDSTVMHSHHSPSHARNIAPTLLLAWWTYIYAVLRC